LADDDEAIGLGPKYVMAEHDRGGVSSKNKGSNNNCAIASHGEPVRLDPTTALNE